jgi:hypothetical protein
MSELLILALTFVLCVYWFRYNCRAILKTAAASDRVRQVAAANQLRFPEVLDEVEGRAEGEMERLNGTLIHDYLVLTCLLRYTSGPRASGYTFEQRILMLDFRFLQSWYRLTRGIMPGTARRALGERARILAHFARTLSERSAALSRL